jgi:hypothetical protein
MGTIFKNRDPRVRHEAFVTLSGRRCRLIIAPGCEEYGQIQVWQHFFTLVVLQGSGGRQFARTLTWPEITDPTGFALGAANAEAARSMTDEFEAIKKNGEFDRIVAEMRLE